MKRLSKSQETKHRDIAAKLQAAMDGLDQAVGKYNEAVAKAYAELQPAVEAMNTAIGDANGFVEEVHEEQQSYYDDRSDTWREGDAGSEYEGWMGEWEVEIEEIEIEEPEELEVPDLDLESFDNLPAGPG